MMRRLSASVSSSRQRRCKQSCRPRGFVRRALVPPLRIVGTLL